MITDLKDVWPKYVLAIDPGKTLGVAWIMVPENKPAKVTMCYEADGTPSGTGVVFRNWMSWIHRHTDFDKGQTEVQVVIEDWSYRHGVPVDARQACVPLGIILYLCGEAGVSVALRGAQARMMWPDVNEKERTPEGYWYPKLKAHDDRVQALRHGMSFIINEWKHLPTLNLLRPK